MPIYFPPTDEAGNDFLPERGDDVPPGTEVVTPDEGDLLHVWLEGGLFDRINDRMDCMIGEYEAELIDEDRMTELLAVVQEWMRDHQGTTVLMPLAVKLAQACEAAISRGAYAWFVF